MLTHRGSRTLATGEGTEAITPTLLTWPHSPAYKAGSEKQRALESSCLALAPPAPAKGLRPPAASGPIGTLLLHPVLEVGVGELLVYPGCKILFLQSIAHLLPPASSCLQSFAQSGHHAPCLRAPDSHQPEGIGWRHRPWAGGLNKLLFRALPICPGGLYVLQDRALGP